MSDQNQNGNLRVEAIICRIKEAIAASPSVNTVVSALEDHHQKISGMKQTLEDNAARKILLTNEMEEITKSFGDSPDDMKRISDIRAELSNIDEFNSRITVRLEHDDGLKREGRDLDRTFGRLIRQIIDPIRIEYQDIVNQQFNNVVQILSDFGTAIDSSWPRALTDGTLIYSDYKDRASCKLTVTDVVDRLGGYTDEFLNLKVGAFSHAMTMQQPSPVTEPQRSPVKVVRPQRPMYREPAPARIGKQQRPVHRNSGSGIPPQTPFKAEMPQGAMCKTPAPAKVEKPKVSLVYEESQGKNVHIYRVYRGK